MWDWWVQTISQALHIVGQACGKEQEGRSRGAESGVGKSMHAAVQGALPPAGDRIPAVGGRIQSKC